MCDPVLGGAAATAAAGLLMQSQAERGAANDREAFTKAEADRQNALADQGEAAALDSLGAFSNPDQLGGGTGRQASVIRLLNERAGPNMATPGVSGAPTAAMTNQIVNQGAAEGKDRAGANVRLLNFGDGLTGAGRTARNNAMKIGFLNDAANRSAGALGTEVGSVNGSSPIGEILFQAGNLGLAYGATRPGQVDQFGGKPPVPKAKPARV